MTKLTRRKFLVSGATAAGSAAVAPAALAALSSSGQAGGPAQTAGGCDAQSVRANIHIAAGESVHTMRGGIGASFHAVSGNLPGTKPSGSSWSGSESGGNPDADDDRHWEE